MLEIDLHPSWIDPMKRYLEMEEPPNDPIEARIIERRSTKFTLRNGKHLRTLITKTDMNLLLYTYDPKK